MDWETCRLDAGYFHLRGRTRGALPRCAMQRSRFGPRVAREKREQIEPIHATREGERARREEQRRGGRPAYTRPRGRWCEGFGIGTEVVDALGQTHLALKQLSPTLRSLQEQRPTGNDAGGRATA